jgi:hypothetical protein
MRADADQETGLPAVVSPFHQQAMPEAFAVGIVPTQIATINALTHATRNANRRAL